jgi:hypothetical protein
MEKHLIFRSPDDQYGRERNMCTLGGENSSGLQKCKNLATPKFFPGALWLPLTVIRPQSYTAVSSFFFTQWGTGKPGTLFLSSVFCALFHAGERKSKLIWIDNKERDTDVRQFFFPFFKTKTAYC